MELRTILYGYRKEYRSYYIVPEEAKTVRRIFADYISGKSLKSIADALTKEKVVYYQDKTTWTKSAVSRIIENAHYAGDFEYPAIISKEDFETAFDRKNSRGGTREKDTEKIAWLKGRMRCGVCGRRVTRIRHYSYNRERWICVDGCKTEMYVDDEILDGKLLSVLQKITENPSLLEYGATDGEESEMSLNVIRNEREIDRMIEQKNPAFQPLKKAIYENAAKRFDECRMDYSGAVTATLQAYVKQLSVTDELDFDMLKRLVIEITLHKHGNVSVRFLNHKTVEEKEEAVYENGNAAEGSH